MIGSMVDMQKVLACITEGDTELAVRHVILDSREAREGDLFFALKGRKTDGHLYIQEAFARGAVGAVVQREWAEAHVGLSTRNPRQQNSPYLIVDSPLKVLKQLARSYRERFPDLKVIAISGSNGKTTTKEILAAILGRYADTLWSRGNLNSEEGLPLSVFCIEKKHKYAIFEIGIDKRKTMHELAGIVRPDYAAITNIGAVHTEFLGSKEGVAQEKRDLFAHFTGEQVAFLSEKEPFSPFLASEVRGKVLYFGPKSIEGFEGSQDLGILGQRLCLNGREILFPLLGEHNLWNALAAIRISREIGVPERVIGEGLEAVKPLPGRSEVIAGEISLLLDYYNASWASSEAIILWMASLPWEGRKAIILSQILELGSLTKKVHHSLGELLATKSFEAIFLYGTQMRTTYEVIEASLFSGRLFWTERFELLREEVLRWVCKGDFLLLKGSRSMRLERLVPDLTGERI